MKSSDSKDILSALAGSGSDTITTRPVIMGTHGMVTSGHYLASRIGLSTSVIDFAEQETKFLLRITRESAGVSTGQANAIRTSEFPQNVERQKQLIGGGAVVERRRNCL